MVKSTLLSMLVSVAPGASPDVPLRSSVPEPVLKSMALPKSSVRFFPVNLAQEKADYDSKVRLRTASLSLFGVAAAGAAVSVVGYSMAANAKGAVRDQSSFPIDMGRREELVQQGNSGNAIGIAGAAAGSAAITIALVLLVKSW